MNQLLNVSRIKAANATDHMPFKIKTLKIKLCLTRLIVAFAHYLYLSRFKSQDKNWRQVVNLMIICVLTLKMSKILKPVG